MKKLINIKEGHILSLIKARIPLESVYVLGLVKNNKEIPEEMGKYLQTLQRKAYIDMKGNITEYGTKLWVSLFKDPSKTVTKTKRNIIKNDDFERWWGIFPSSDVFTINGREFTGTRSMKTGKENCKKMFQVIMNEGILGRDVIGATEWMFKTAREKSARTGQNQLSYIPASERFLRERKFMPFIEISKKKEEQKTKEFEI